jgi:hypothetical protein
MYELYEARIVLQEGSAITKNFNMLHEAMLWVNCVRDKVADLNLRIDVISIARDDYDRPTEYEAPEGWDKV